MHTIILSLIIFGCMSHAKAISLFDLIGVNTLEEFCNMISKPNCTCENITIPDKVTGIAYDLCALVEGTATTPILPTLTTLSNVPKCTSGLNWTWIDWFQIVMTILASIIGILGNTLVIIVYYFIMTTRSNHDILILMLAINDLIFAIIQIVLIVPTTYTKHWVFGVSMCKILYSAISMGANVAIGIILIIAIERYKGICNPFCKGLSSHKISTLLSVNFILSLITVAPRLIILNVKNCMCTEQWPHQRQDSLIYSCTTFVAYCLIPLVSISALYWKCIGTLNRSAKQQLQAVSSVRDVARGRSLQANRRVMKILIYLLAAFIGLTLPNKVKWVVFDAVDAARQSATFQRAFSIVGNITYPFHVAINPIIYSCVDQKFRSRVKELFILKMFKKQKDYGASAESFEMTAPNARGSVDTIVADLRSLNTMR